MASNDRTLPPEVVRFLAARNFVDAQAMLNHQHHADDGESAEGELDHDHDAVVEDEDADEADVPSGIRLLPSDLHEYANFLITEIDRVRDSNHEQNRLIAKICTDNRSKQKEIDMINDQNIKLERELAKYKTSAIGEVIVPPAENNTAPIEDGMRDLHVEDPGETSHDST